MRRAIQLDILQLPVIPKDLDAPIPPDGEHIPNPRELYIEVTNRCNSLCETCPLTFDPQESAHYLTFDEFTGLVDQFPDLERAVLHGIGEPLLNKDLGPMISYLKQRNVRVVFNSNAVLLTSSKQTELIESGLDEIRVSCDGSTPETYEKMRGIDKFPLILRNVEALLKRRREMNAHSPKVSLWMTGVKDNIHELPGLIEIAGRIGADEVYLTRMVFFGTGLAVENQSIYRDFRAEAVAVIETSAALAKELGVDFQGAGAISPTENFADEVPDRAWSGCRRPWRLGYVTANGNALPCCIAPFTGADYESIKLGNVIDEGSFNAVWNGEKYREFRRQFLSDDPPDACRRCGLDWSL